jgi:hypothetical protein
MKISVPQQVSVARVEVLAAASNTLEGYEIPMGLGEKQVAIVLASKLCIRAGDGTDSNRIWLIRKSEENISTVATWPNEAGTWQQDPSVFDHLKAFRTALTSVGINDKIDREYKVYPYPVVLIRNPTMVIYGAQGRAFTAILWYMLEDVTNAELAQLMVKDHA